MGPLGLMAVGAGIGLLQQQEQKKQAAAQRTLAAETARNSPWTGLTPDMNIQEPSTMGTIGQGAFSGYALGQSAQAAGEQAKMNAAMTSNLEANTKALQGAAQSATAATAAAPVAATAMPGAQSTVPMPPAGGAGFNQAAMKNLAANPTNMPGMQSVPYMGGDQYAQMAAGMPMNGMQPGAYAYSPWAGMGR